MLKNISDTNYERAVQKRCLDNKEILAELVFSFIAWSHEFDHANYVTNSLLAHFQKKRF